MFLLFFPGLVFKTKDKNKLDNAFPFGLLCPFCSCNLQKFEVNYRGRNQESFEKAKKEEKAKREKRKKVRERGDKKEKGEKKKREEGEKRKGKREGLSLAQLAQPAQSGHTTQYY